MVLIKKLLDKLPKSLEGTKPVLLYPFLGILAMGAIMIFLVNPPVGAFNTWLNDMLAGMGESSKILLGAVLGGMMSIDFGGPFNKAAYVFGTAAIASGQIDIMAAVMIGGMTPPIGIALDRTEPSLKTGLPRVRSRPRLRTISWVYPLLRKGPFLLRHPIR